MPCRSAVDPEALIKRGGLVRSVLLRKAAGSIRLGRALVPVHILYTIQISPDRPCEMRNDMDEFA